MAGSLRSTWERGFRIANTRTVGASDGSWDRTTSLVVFLDVLDAKLVAGHGDPEEEDQHEPECDEADGFHYRLITTNDPSLQ